MEIQLPDINNRTLNIHGFDVIDCKKVNVTDHYSVNSFLFPWIKSTKMKVRPYFAMQKVQKLLKTP